LKKVYPIFEQIFKNNQEGIAYIVLGVITFQLSVNFSKDWYNYQFFFDTYIRDVNWHNFLASVSIFQEPLYLITAKIIAQLTSFTTFVFCATVTLLTLKLHYLRKITNNFYLGSFFYICFYLLLFEGTGLRIGYAVAFVIPALYCLKQQKPLYSFLLIMVASQIHLTTLVFLIAFPIYYFSWIKIAIYVSFILSILMVAFDISFVSLSEPFFVAMNSKYLMYFYHKFLETQNSTGLFYYFIVFFALLLSVIFYYLKNLFKRDEFMHTIFLISFCAIISMIVLHEYVAIAARIAELLLVPIVILLSQLYIEFNAEKMHFHRNLLIVLSLMFFSARVVYLYPSIFFG